MCIRDSSNTPKTTSECSKLLYYVPIWYPESFVPKNWVEGVRRVCQTLKYSALTKCSILHAVLSLFFKSQSTCMWVILRMQNCFHTCLKQGCKVSGPDSDIKWVIGLFSGVVDTANKTPNLSSVFTDSQCILHFPSQMHMGHKSLGIIITLCKWCLKSFEANSISKWAVGATAFYLTKASKITHPHC